jgi:hypothetical protein
VVPAAERITGWIGEYEAARRRLGLAA